MRTPVMMVAAFGLVAAGFAVGRMLAPTRANSIGQTHAEGEPPTESAPPRAFQTDGLQTKPTELEHRDFSSRIAELARTRNPTERTRMIAAIADNLDAGELREALVAIESRGMRDRDAVRLQLLSRWAQLEPAAALVYAKRLPSGSIAPGAIKAVITTWLGQDSPAAEKAIATMGEGFATTIARGALVEFLADKDPRRALALLQKNGLFGDSVEGLFKSWSISNPEEAADHARLLPSGFLRDLALRSAMEGFARKDREAALAWAQSLPGTGVPGGSIERREPGPLAEILKVWMAEDASAALAWIEQLPEGLATDDALAALSRALAAEDPHQAIEVAARMPEGKAQNSALGKLMRSWGEKDFAGALQWAREQDEDMQLILLPSLVSQLAPRDTSAALELASSIRGEEGQRALSSVLRSWMRKDPVTAAAWAAEQPNNSALVREVAFSWAGQDQTKARNWVGALPSGAMKDEALLSGVRCIVQGDRPQSAEQWVQAIGDAERRESAYWELAYAWLRFNPKEARAWLETAPLSQKHKRDLLNPQTR